jgi:hypothetical protein
MRAFYMGAIYIYLSEYRRYSPEDTFLALFFLPCISIIIDVAIGVAIRIGTGRGRGRRYLNSHRGGGEGVGGRCVCNE